MFLTFGKKDQSFEAMVSETYTCLSAESIRLVNTFRDFECVVNSKFLLLLAKWRSLMLLKKVCCMSVFFSVAYSPFSF